MSDGPDRKGVIVFQGKEDRMKAHEKTRAKGSKGGRRVRYKVTDRGVVFTTSSEILSTKRAKAQLLKFASIEPARVAIISLTGKTT